MFKFNELSDLKDGSLVTPLRATEDDTVICIDQNGNEIEVDFDDFDFDKTEMERVFEVEEGDDIITEPEPEEPIIPDEEDEPIIDEPEDEPTIDEPEDEPVITEEKKGWITNPANKFSVLKKFNYTCDDINKVNICYTDII